VNTAPDGTRTHVISLSNIRKSFGNEIVLKNVDLHVEPGNVTSIIGSSGGGKTTLLRCINLLEVPQSGRIVVNGAVVFDPAAGIDGHSNLATLRRSVGMVFQQFHLFPHLTAVENITLPLRRVLKLGQQEATELALVSLDRVGIGAKALAYPDQMSGGQQQRTAIARALAMRPVGLLFDEPTSALDPESRSEVNKVIRELAEAGLTMVVVTHDLEFAGRISDDVVFMDRGEIVESGPPEQILRNPVENRTAQFVSSHSA